jgi:hypothetical protein
MRRPIAYVGPVRTVAFAVCLVGGVCIAPGFEFYRDELDDTEQGKLHAMFVLMGETGVIRDRRKFKHLEGTDLLEFKSFQIRMPCYYLPGGLLVITHGFRKQCDRIPPCEFARANRIRQGDTLLFLNPEGRKKC